MRSYSQRSAAGLAALVLGMVGCGDAATFTDPAARRASSTEATFDAAATAGIATPLTITPSGGSLVVGTTRLLTATPNGLRIGPGAKVTTSWSSSAPTVASVSSAGLVTGMSAGTVTITAVSRSGLSSVRGTISVTVVAQSPVVLPPSGPAAPDTGWTYCTAAGAPCDFNGLRSVRFGPVNGPYVEQIAYGSVPCANYGFGGRNPAPNQPLHCDYGPITVQLLVNPMPGMSAGLGAQVTVPVGSSGASGVQVQPAGISPTYTDGSGSFRTTCSMARYAFDDPIVFPGRPGAAHLHMFFGNTGVTAMTTPDAVASTGNSTCRGGTLNRTGYWMPAVVDAQTGEVQVPGDAVVYYKTGYNMDPATIQPFPAGLRMIGGNMAASSAAQQPYGVDWGCRDHYVQSTGAIPTTCPVGDAVRLTILFPQCWDGVNLDSPDHKRHMAMPNYRNAPERSTCPADHPVALPAISEHFDFAMTARSVPARWRLSSDMYAAGTPGGYSAHADWMNGWDPATMQLIVRQCLNKAVDCQVGLLGDGRALY